jgi:hypothetical protein
MRFLDGGPRSALLEFGVLVALAMLLALGTVLTFGNDPSDPASAAASPRPGDIIPPALVTPIRDRH